MKNKELEKKTNGKGHFWQREYRVQMHDGMVEFFVRLVAIIKLACLGWRCVCVRSLVLTIN